MNETMKPSCGEAYDATPVAVLAASETLTIALGMLTKSPVAAIVAGGLTGCVCSLALPAISGRILSRKRDAILSWWDENLEVYKKFKVENPDREPSKRAEKREERDLAIWWLDAMRLVRTKELMREKVEALIETGSRMPDGVNLDDYETVEEYRARYVAPVSKMTSAMLSLAVGLGTAATCYVGMTGNLHSPLLFLLGGITSILVTAVGAMCDQRSRVLPSACLSPHTSRRTYGVRARRCKRIDRQPAVRCGYLCDFRHHQPSLPHHRRRRCSRCRRSQARPGDRDGMRVPRHGIRHGRDVHRHARQLHPPLPCERDHP